jgi:hypothetical protein
MEVARKSFYQDGKDFDLAVARGVEALLKFYGDMDVYDDEAKSWSRMAGALDYYFQEFPLATDAIKPLRLADRYAIECTFAIPIEGTAHPITGDPILYAGRFDMLGERDGVVFVVDEKTSSQLGPTWSQKWDLRGQITGYVWGAQQYGFPVAGCIIRGVSILKTGYGIAEAPVYRSKWEIDRWLDGMRRRINRAAQIWANDEEWLFALDEACAAYSGCGFKRLCQVQDPTPYVPVYFEENTWDPLSIRG